MRESSLCCRRRGCCYTGAGIVSAAPIGQCVGYFGRARAAGWLASIVVGCRRAGRSLSIRPPAKVAAAPPAQLQRRLRRTSTGSAHNAESSIIIYQRVQTHWICWKSLVFNTTEMAVIHLTRRQSAKIHGAGRKATLTHFEFPTQLQRICA